MPDNRPTSPRESAIHILHLEDSAADAELVQAMLREEGVACSITRLATREAYQTALGQETFDLILCDFSMPGFDGLSALTLARERCPAVPFIFLSGTIGEEVAVEALKQGATDYVIKNRLSRLAPVVQRALREAQEQARRRRMEEELHRQDELLRQIAASFDDLIVVLDAEGRRQYVSPSYQRLFGTADELRGTVSFAEIHPEDKERIQRVFRQTVATGIGQRAEYRFVLKDDSIRYIESQGSVIRDQQGNVAGVVVVSRDITDRRQTEEQIRQQAALLDKAQDAICLNDIDQRILYWNQGAARLYGWKSEEAIGKNANDLLFQGKLNAPMAALKSLIATGGWQGELRQATKGGREIVVESRWTLLRGDRGTPKSILVINTDITEKKQLEEQFLRTQRLQGLGALAGGIAHDLNNVLSPILMVADLIRDDLGSEESRRMLDTAQASAERGAEMVKQILSFARGVNCESVVLQVKHLVNDMAKLAKDTFPKAIQVQIQVAPELHSINGNPTQLHQVLLNLCVNARDAMPEGGTLRVEATNVLLDRVQTPMHTELVTGPHVALTVSDTGTGIPPELLSKIFEPFFTTKEAGKGTGLGLSTVMSIVKRHDGFIDVSSEAGRGTTFKVYLPAATTTAAAASDPSSQARPTGNGEQVLLVDDDIAILEMTKATLEAFNYRVLTATNGAEGANLYQLHQRQIDVVVTDMMMPVMDGAAMVRALREFNPDVKVIGISGLGSRAKLAQTGPIDVQAFLTKPYPAEEMLLTLRRVLESPNDAEDVANRR